MVGFNKLVTAIVVVYNGEKYLRDCLQSIVDQNYSLLEIIVVDDGSTDSTPDIVKSFGEKIRYYRQDNAGIANARNKGIKLAGGDFIAFLDADDFWCPRKISTQVMVFDKYPQYGVVFGDFSRVDDLYNGTMFSSLNIKSMKAEIDGNWSGWLYPKMLLDSWIHIITAMIRKEIFSDIGGFNIDNIVGEDYDFWIRVSFKYQIAKIPYSLALYRDNPDSVTSKFLSRNFPAEIVTKYSKKYGITHSKGGTITKRQIQKRLTDLWIMHGYIARINGQYSHAIKSFSMALNYQPYNLKAYKNISFIIFKLVIMYLKGS